MKIVTYLGFTLLSILIQFSVIDFIQSIMQIDEQLIKTANATSQRRQLRDVLKDYNHKPHALYYRTQLSKLTNDNAPAKIYDNSTIRVELTTTESAVFEVLYDESTPTTEDETPFTTEAFHTSTELDNVTEITFFGKTNQTTTKPSIKPKKEKNKDCKCNYLYGVCDINCCCDVDCTEVEIQMFPNCTKNITISADHADDLCYSHLVHFGHDGPVTKIMNNWFCIVKINLPKKTAESKKINLLTADKFFSWKGIKKPKINHEFKNKIYEYGDPIWLIKNGSIYYVDLPSPMMNNYCTGRKTIQFLKDQKISCQVKIRDLEMFQIMKSSDEANVISAILLSMNSTYLNCSNLHCVNWTLIVCKDQLCTNYNKSLHEPVCTESICTNLALKLEYIFNYHDLKITNATIKFHVQNVPINLHFMVQELEVKFILANKSIDHVLKISGNPGYSENMPIILSYAKHNYTETFFNKSSTLKTYFTLPTSQGGICVASNLTNSFVLYGMNKRIKCRYHHKYTKLYNSTEQCKSIQYNLNELLDLKRKFAVSSMGNPQNLGDKDWILVEFNVTDKAILYGELQESLKLDCYNIITRYSFVFSYAEIDGFNRILDIKLETTSRNASFNLDDLSAVVTVDVNFIDVSRPSIIEYASGPHLNFYLPNDLFLPFPSNECPVVSSMYILLFCCCIAVLASK